MENGLIAPFQGFWVKANALNPSLIISEKAKTFGDTFIGKANVQNTHSFPEIGLKFKMEIIHQAHFFNLRIMQAEQKMWMMHLIYFLL